MFGEQDALETQEKSRMASAEKLPPLRPMAPWLALLEVAAAAVIWSPGSMILAQVQRWSGTYWTWGKKLEHIGPVVVRVIAQDEPADNRQHHWCPMH